MSLKSRLKSLAHQVTHPLETVKNVASNVNHEVKAAGKSIGDAAKKVGGKLKEGAEFAVLIPFIPSMTIALKAKGIKVPKTVKGIAAAFYVHILNHPAKHLENLDADATEAQTFEAAKAIAANSGVPASGIALDIVHKIIDFLRGLGKKKTGEKLTKDEAAVVGDATPEENKDLLDATDKVTDKLAAASGGVDSKGNVHFVNKDGEVTHILTKNGNVVETGKQADYSYLFGSDNSLVGLVRRNRK